MALPRMIEASFSTGRHSIALMVWLSPVALLLLVAVGALEGSCARQARRSPEQSEAVHAWRGLRVLKLRVVRYLLFAGVVASGVRDGGVVVTISALLLALALVAAVGWVGLLTRLRIKGEWPARHVGQ